MRFTVPLSAVVLLMACTSMAYAQDDAKKTKLETDAVKRTPATSIDFNAELQVPVQALAHLGRSIEDARDEGDPICIASAANILAAAESMAGDKKAAITAEQLWKEAIALAELRNSSAELAILAKLASGDVAADLKERSAAAKKDEAAKNEAEKAGETNKDLDGDLHISNQSHEYVRIYIDGRYYGQLAPHASTELHLHHAHELEAHSHYHLWNEHVEGHQHHYDWVIRDPHH
jgi:hypothetical protein